MPMPNRHIQDANGYRYAYQGQEKDPETGKEAFELRLWDGRIGRWLSPDPYGAGFSPYWGMNNNPISLIDPDGGCPECPEGDNGGKPYTDSAGIEWTYNGDHWDGGFDQGTINVFGSNGNNAAAYAANQQAIYNFFNPVDLSSLVSWIPEPSNINVWSKGQGIDYVQDTNENDSSVWYVDTSQMTDIPGGGTNLRGWRYKKGSMPFNTVKYTVKLVKFGKSSGSRADKIEALLPLAPKTADSIFEVNSIWCCNEDGHHSIHKGYTKFQTDSIIKKESDISHTVKFTGIRN